MAPLERRGISIPLKESSWRLIAEALIYLVEKPHIDDLEESRERLGQIAHYIKDKLYEVSRKPDAG